MPNNTKEFINQLNALAAEIASMENIDPANPPADSGSYFLISTALRDPKTGSLVKFDLKPGERKYRYFQGKSGAMYCYTPHKDTTGHYWCWTYAPVGKGSQSGNPTHWKMKNPVRYSQAKLAKKWALARYEKEMRS